MRPKLLLIPLVLLSNIQPVIGSSSEIINRIQSVHTKFQQEGPTIDVLNTIDLLVKDLDEDDHNTYKDQLAQVYFKKSLIEISLNKIKSAIDDLIKVLEIDPLMKPAQNKLIDLLVEQAEFETIQKYLDSKDEKHQKIDQDIKEWGKSLAKVESLVTSKKLKDKEVEECLNTLDDVLIPFTPSNPLLYQYRLVCLKKSSLNLDNFKPIIKTLDKLIKLQPMKDLDNYSDISQLLLFTQTNFGQSWHFVKNCLRINNDFKKCGSLSKMFVKFQNFLKLLEDYSIWQGHVYLISEESSNKIEDIEIDWEFANKFLFENSLQVSKLEMKNLPRKVKSNYDYLMHKADEFSKEFSTDATKLSFTQDLNKFACESFIQLKDYKNANQFCKSNVNDDINENPFFPKHVPKIDKLLKEKNYQEAANLLNKFNKNVKGTQLFLDRLKIIEAYDKKRQQQQHFRQQQQQQQRQRQYQQQQQQQQQRQKPANDYYKILDIARDADEKTIKKAHRTQTLKYHPDKYKGNDLTPEQIEHKMQEINKAYEVLSNKELRERYDQGDDPNDPMGGQRQQQHHNPFGGGGGGFQFNSDFMRQFMKQGNGGSFHFGGFGGQRQGQKFGSRKKKSS